MKKLLLASAVAALSISAAQAAPQVYGKAFLTLDVQDGNSNSATKDSRSQLNSVGSRIGFKGSEALTANTDLVYQLEYRLDIDDNTGTGADANFEARDTYVGLSNKQYGTLVAGRLTAIDDYINYANVAEGGVIGGNNVLASVDGPRANNAFAYFSPDYNGVQLMGMYALDENNASDSLNGDAWGVGAKYEPANQPFKAGVTYIKASNGDVQTATTTTATPVYATTALTGAPVGYIASSTTAVTGGKELSALRLSGSYDVAPNVTVGALYQNTKWKTAAKKENAYTVSAKVKTATPWTAYGQLDLVDNVGGSTNAEVFRTVVGGEYAFNQATSAHIYGAYQRSENTNLSTNATGNKANAYGIGAGIEYKF